MEKHFTRFISLLLSICLIIGMLPLSTFAEEDESPVRVSFVCSPESVTLTVKQGDEKISPEDDGVYLLAPGEYIYTAECDGHESVQNQVFSVDSDTSEINITLNEILDTVQETELPATESAENNIEDIQRIASGNIGTNITWDLNTNGTLSIQGVGDVDVSIYQNPWANYRDQITEITVGEGITGLFQYAFSDCKNLVKVSLPDSLEKVAEGVFCDCTNLFGITIPEKVTEISPWMLGRCSSLSYLKLSSKTIKFGYSAFEGCSSLEQFIIPSTVQEIGDYAFSGCKKIKELIIPASVSKIGGQLFENCDSLSKVVFLGDKPDIDSRMLDYISIDIFYPAFNKTYDYMGKFDGNYGNNRYHKYCDSTTLGHTSIIVDDSVASTCTRKGLTEGSHCNNCGEIIKQQESTPALGHKYDDNVLEHGYRKCLVCGLVDAYASGQCGKNVYWIREEDGKLTIYGTGKMYDYEFGDSPFRGWSGMTIEIEDGVTSIGDFCFASFANIRSISIANTVESIGDHAFFEAGLTFITVPNSVRSIGLGAFSSCRNLQSAELPDNLDTVTFSLFSGCSSLKSIAIPSKTTQIRESAFNGCSALRSVRMPESVNYIGEGAFYLCDSLENIYYAGSELQFNSIYIAKKNQCFTETTKHYAVETMTGRCGENVTYELTNDGIMTIKGMGAMYNYGSLNNAAPWYNCKDLIKKTIIEEGVSSIGEEAFSHAELLTEVRIPHSVITIGYCAFFDCNAIMIVYYDGCIHDWRNIASDDIQENVVKCSIEKCTTLGSIKLSSTLYSYDGKVKTPTVTVTDSNGETLVKDKDYTVSYASGRKNVGTYKVTVKGKGDYSFTETLTFKINPVKTSIKKLTAGSKSFKATWSKKTTQTTGYQIQYSLKKDFSSGNKTATVSSNATTSKTIKSLKGGKTYYVRIRTYKTVDGKKYYSGWSAVKSVKTK